MKKYKYKDVVRLVDEFMSSNHYSMLLTFEDDDVVNFRALVAQVQNAISKENVYFCKRGKNMIWFEKYDWKEEKND